MMGFQKPTLLSSQSVEAGSKGHTRRAIQVFKSVSSNETWRAIIWRLPHEKRPAKVLSAGYKPELPKNNIHQNHARVKTSFASTAALSERAPSQRSLSFMEIKQFYLEIVMTFMNIITPYNLISIRTQPALDFWLGLLLFLLRNVMESWSSRTLGIFINHPHRSRKVRCTLPFYLKMGHQKRFSQARGLRKSLYQKRGKNQFFAKFWKWVWESWFQLLRDEYRVMKH